MTPPSVKMQLRYILFLKMIQDHYVNSYLGLIHIINHFLFCYHVYFYQNEAFFTMWSAFFLYKMSDVRQYLTRIPT